MCISTLLNKIVDTEIYTLKIMCYFFLKYMCNTCSDKIVFQIKYTLSEPKTHVAMNKTSSL